MRTVAEILGILLWCEAVLECLWEPDGDERSEFWDEDDRIEGTGMKG